MIAPLNFASAQKMGLDMPMALNTESWPAKYFYDRLLHPSRSCSQSGA